MADHSKLSSPSCTSNGDQDRPTPTQADSRFSPATSLLLALVRAELVSKEVGLPLLTLQVDLLLTRHCRKPEELDLCTRRFGYSELPEGGGEVWAEREAVDNVVLSFASKSNYIPG